MTDNPFDLSNATIKAENHVRVTRQAPRQGLACTYWKIFQAQGLTAADYWTNRENKLIAGLWSKDVKRVVKLHNLTNEARPNSSPMTEQIATFDAGLSLDKWLEIKPHYRNGQVLAHPFQALSVLLDLAWACLDALKSIHEKGYVHLDLRADNICLPYEPYPYPADNPPPIKPCFARLALIDFAFSISPDLPLRHPLPILPTGKGQSERLRQALDIDSQGRGVPPFAVDRLDWRCDLVSLGHMLDDIVQRNGVLAPGLDTHARLQRLIDELKAYDHGEAAALEPPHLRLMAKIKAWQDSLPASDDYFSFVVVRNKGHNRRSLWRKRLRRLAYGIAAGSALALLFPPALGWWQHYQQRAEYEAIKNSPEFQAWWDRGNLDDDGPPAINRWLDLGEQLVQQGDLHAALERAAIERHMGLANDPAWRYLQSHRDELRRLAEHGPPNWQAAARQVLEKMQ